MNIRLPHDLSNHSKSEFLQIFNELYEHSPWVIEQSFTEISTDEKYNNLDLFHNKLTEIELAADKKSQDDLIKAHPLLAGKKAQNNELTDFSTNEQKSAGLSDCTDTEIKLFNELNQKYLNKFNFPFIIAVMEKNKAEIIDNFQTRLKNDLMTERQTALNEINKIAKIRIKQIYGI